MVAVQTMHSEKVGDIQKVLNHLLRESSEEHLKKPLTLTSDLSFLYVLYSVPHNKMILNDSEVSCLRFVISTSPYTSQSNEIAASFQQKNGFYINAVSDTDKIDTAIDKYAEKLLLRYLISLLIILLISIYLLDHYMRPLAVLATKIHQWQSGDSFHFSLGNASSEIEEVSSSFTALIHKLETFRTKEAQLFQEAAHELKTPLALMRSRLDVYESRSDYTKEKFIHDAGHDIDRLSTELKNVLFLESSDFDDPITLHIAPLLTTILAKVEILAQRKKLTLEVPAQSFSVTVSEKLLHKILLALIENAMTYARYDSRILIDIDPHLRTLSLTNKIGGEKYLFSSKIGGKMLKRLEQELPFSYRIIQNATDYTIVLTFL